METMSNLRTVSTGINREPQITAGNSSPLNAGAGCAVLMSRNRAEELGIKPMVTIRSIGWAGVNPGVMGQGPVPLYAMKMLNIPSEKVNVKGGAIALGHPLGMTGVRLVGTLARILQAEGGKLGLATACVGGGQGVATIIEKI